MASQGPNSPSSGSNDNATGSLAWSGTGNIFSSNNSKAQATGGSVTNYLKATGFGFSIPSGATIDGISVDIERNNGAFFASNVNDSTIKIIKGGVIAGTNRAVPATFWPLVDTTANYGSSSDLWGTTWTDTDINASNFGVAISARGQSFKASATPAVDFVSITIYYTAGGGGGSVAAKSNFMILETDD